MLLFPHDGKQCRTPQTQACTKSAESESNRIRKANRPDSDLPLHDRGREQYPDRQKHQADLSDVQCQRAMAAQRQRGDVQRLSLCEGTWGYFGNPDARNAAISADHGQRASEPTGEAVGRKPKERYLNVIFSKESP